MSHAPLGPKVRAVLEELRAGERAREARYTEIAGVSGESDSLRSGSGLVLTPQAGAAPRHEGKS